jgi:hypothetical protein
VEKQNLFENKNLAVADIWHNAIATKDNLLKRRWIGSASCQFCHKD